MARLRTRHVVTFASALALVATSCSSGDSLAADAGDDFSVGVGESPSFDGCESSGEIANFSWTISEAPDGVADQVGKPIREVSAECSFVLDAAMVPEEVGEWTIELTVSDEAGATSTDSVVIEVTQ